MRYQESIQVTSQCFLMVANGDVVDKMFVVNTVTVVAEHHVITHGLKLIHGNIKLDWKDLNNNDHLSLFDYFKHFLY